MSPDENISELKKRISSMVKNHPEELRAFIKENEIMVLDVLHDAITNPNNLLDSHTTAFNNIMATLETDEGEIRKLKTSVLNDCYFILSNFAWADVIQSRFIIPSINLYLTTFDKLLRKEIIYFLINVYYDDTFHQELIDSGFNKCLPKYIHDWDVHLKTRRWYIQDKNEVNILCNMLRLYINNNPEYNTDTMDTYHALISTCSNLSFYDVHDSKLIDVAREIYFKYEDAPQLHNEILFFLSNIYLDEEASTLAPDFNKYANHFITTYHATGTVADDLIMDILEIYKLDEFIPSVLDVAIQLLNDNLDNRKNFNRIIKFYRTVADDKESCDYICNHPISKRMIQYSIQSGIHVYQLSHVYSYFTSHRETEIPCLFYYNHFIVPLSENNRQIYPSYTLFSLSNILAVLENYSFVDTYLIAKFLTLCFYRYNDDSELYTNLYYVIHNLYDAGYLHRVLQVGNFITVFQTWMDKIEYADDIGNRNDAYSIIKYICKTISQHDELHYIYNDDDLFIDIVLNIAHKTYVLGDIEQYLNCTLEKKCALFLYKKNKIKLEELDELDVRIHVMA